MNYCPDCQGKLRIRDSRQRKIKDEIGNEYVFRLRRFQCVDCKKIHIEIPDCIEPFKQYSKNTIESILSGKCNYYTVDDSTVRRWKNM